MKHSKIIYPLVAALILIVAAVYAVNSHTKEASVFSMPDFAGTTHIPKADKQPASTLEDLNNAFVNIAKQTNPTVVTIRVKQTVEVQRNPFFRFFGDESGGTRKQERRGIGSGVIVSKDGYILTNNHVVHNADNIEVQLNDNQSYSGKVVGTDPLTDLAVVKVNADNLPAINMGNSDNLRVGELVMAIGSPEQLSHTVTQGIVSAKNRHINLIKERQGANEISGFENYIQTDAAINPGNSGGALVNMDGELVGINAAIATTSGSRGNIGIGFAVPINLARSVMKQIIENGEVAHAELGVVASDVTEALAQGLNLENDKGILVNSVKRNSSADKAGLKQGDVIKTLNGQPVKNIENFRTMIGTSKPGRKITLGVMRDSRKKNLKATLGKLKLESTNSNENASGSMQKHLGFRIDELTAHIARQLDLDPDQQGVVVSDVKKDSKARNNGLQKGDIITKVNKQPIKNISDFEDAINKLADKKNPVLLLQIINRNGNNQFIAFKL